MSGEERMVGVSNPVGAPISPRFLTAIVRIFQRVLPCARGRDVSVVLVDRRTSRRLNRTYRGVDAPTDVLSFPAQDRTPWPGADGQLLGEVVVCYPVAVRQAKEYRHGVRREIAELLVHGLAHLVGFDHDTKVKAKKMVAFEANVIAAALRSIRNY